MLWRMEEPKIPPVKLPPIQSSEPAQPPEASVKAANPLLYLVSGVLVGIVAMGGFLYVSNRPKASGEPVVTRSPGTPAVQTDVRNQALSNMKMLSTGAMIYVADHDDVFPLTENWQDGVRPYIKNDAVLSTMNPEGGTIKYAFTSKHVSATALEYPAETILFYDSLPWADGKMLTAYADSHAKYVDVEAFTEQLKMTDERVNRW